MIPSPRVGSGVDVRHTERKQNQYGSKIPIASSRLLSTFWNVNIPRMFVVHIINRKASSTYILASISPKRSNWVPFEVTVKLRLIPAQVPTGPQSVGGLQTDKSYVNLSAFISKGLMYSRELNYFSSEINKRVNHQTVSIPVISLTLRRSSRTYACGDM